MSEHTATKRAPGIPSVEVSVFESEKVKAIKHLILGAANDFNNAVMAISSYAEVELKRSAPAGRRKLEQLLKNTDRASSLMQSLVELCKPSSDLVQTVYLNEVVRSAGMLSSLGSSAPVVELDLDPEEKPVKANSSEIRQAILYALTEAALNEVLNDKLIIRTRLTDQQWTRSGPGDQASALFMELSIGSHSGKSRFLRKSTGDDAVFRMLCSLPGSDTHSAQSSAAGYQVYFPVETIQGGERSQRPQVMTGLKTILVVDDDDAVRVPAIEFLKMEGYRVLQAGNGIEAMQLIKEKIASVDLLLTDISMKGMTGLDLASALRKVNPALKVIFMSGNAPHQTSAVANPDDDSVRLQKPFPLAFLIETVRDLLTS